MLRPTLYPIPAFDSRQETKVSFLWKGDQAFGSRLIIRNNANGQKLYEKDNTTMRLQHTIPPHTLTNGLCYEAVLYVLDSGGEILSDASNSIVFYCFTPPVFRFADLTENQSVKNSSCQLHLTYSQPEGEELAEYMVMLCDTNRHVLQSSGVKYDSARSGTFTGMTDNNSYYARATGKTANGMEVDTGYVLFHVEYIKPNLFAIVNLENVKKKGYVKIQSNIVAIKGKSNPDPPIYIDHDLIDLRKEGSYVAFDEFFDLTDDFSVAIIGKGRTKNPFQMTDGKIVVSLYYREGCYKSRKGRLGGFFELRIPNPVGEAIYQSDYLEPLGEKDYWKVWIKKAGNVFQLYAGLLPDWKEETTL